MNIRRIFEGVSALACCALLSFVHPVHAAEGHAASVLEYEFPPGLIVPPGARMSAAFDADEATRAYMALQSPAQRARSDAYFEGGYWLQLWGFLYSLGVAWVVLAGRRSARMRDWCERLTRRRSLQIFLYAAVYFVVVYALTLPLTVYSDYFREHAYGLANQSFGPWFVEQLIGLGVTALAGALFLIAAYAFVARFAESWWIGLSGFTVVFFLLVIMVVPVWISPLFNDYKVLPDGPVKAAVLGMARANGVPATNVYWFDASKQSNRVSANVSGFLGTTRVSLNDNLLNKTSLPEIKAVMGHELGHYVLHHGFRSAIYYSIVFGVGFAFLQWSGRALIRRWRDRFGLRGLDDVAALPLVWALFSSFLFAATPVLNTITRQQEQEEDLFGLNTAREPYGFSMAALRLSSYRKMSPGALEEMVFFDHPSGHTRIYDSMRWLKENPSAVTSLARDN
jgi:STE24 endopeptidase